MASLPEAPPWRLQRRRGRFWHYVKEYEVGGKVVETGHRANAFPYPTQEDAIAEIQMIWQHRRQLYSLYPR